MAKGDRTVAHFYFSRGPNLLERTEEFQSWVAERSRGHTWPYARTIEASPKATTTIRDLGGAVTTGANFASQDYLGLAAHPEVHAAIIAALDEFGPHSAGSGALSGNTSLSAALEDALAAHLGMPHVRLFPTGWAAGFGSVVGLVRPWDHVVMDSLAHACLQQGASAATQNISRFAHLDVDQAREQVAEIRKADANAGILVITEGVFSMDADTPDVQAMQAMCRDYDATLLVDVAHDLGALGPQGTGTIGAQGMLGKVDLVMGSFSKTFASNGGFLATRSLAVRNYTAAYGGSFTFSNALSPLQAAGVTAALRIVRSPEGDERRAALRRNVESLRSALSAHGLEPMGEPCAVVPVPVGNERVAQQASKLAAERALIVNLSEFPAVAMGKARFRMQVMAPHTEAQTEEAARVVAESIAEARETVETTKGGAGA